MIGKMIVVVVIVVVDYVVQIFVDVDKLAPLAYWTILPSPLTHLHRVVVAAGVGRHHYVHLLLWALLAYSTIQPSLRNHTNLPHRRAARETLGETKGC